LLGMAIDSLALAGPVSLLTRSFLTF